ncbi:hypothetical protein EDD37DRAFT_605052 [Exophiala viscosa]|uniref:DUF221-domain-containing protein n=1 Tax=Exophiala viscosa TaxID=2486360 RepID=A0AAN6IG39_9EURO|nr:hypothetical protein EDD36DRAFT_130819 [Exophiala viscosa]KAI1630194.1 hypothetical protein EDD37DRAFT_605052 [Exophiala viscosa]
MATLTHSWLPRSSTGTGSSRSSSNSLSSIISTLIPTALIALIAFTVFLIIRKKYTRVYRTRGDERLFEQGRRTPKSDGNFFSLIYNFKGLPDSHVLRHNSLDGYLWLRFFKVMIIMSAVGCIICMPVLFPVNATGGGGQTQLDILSMSNVSNPNRYFAHAGVACIYFGFIVLLVARERINFIGLRRAFFLSAAHAQRLSSRTVMVLGLPLDHMDEKVLRQTFGSNVRKIWLATDCKDLEKAVKKQNKTSIKLEGAELKVIKNANKLRTKALKKDNEATEQPATHWIDSKKRPHHRLMPQIWKKVDTINWSRGTLAELDRFVEQQQTEHLDLKHLKVPAAFIEFSNQSAAHHAYQSIGQGKMNKFHPRYIGVQPDEVIWTNLGVSNASRKMKITLATIFIWLLIIFWAIPVAFVGALSNINYLTNKLPFLSFINDIPKVILGVVTGLLPTILLAVLMALVPIICGLLAKKAGEPTMSAVELRVQSWYFAFQVVQVFLITTFTSAATSVTTQIISKPASAPTLLATNLPKASNFYISYFILLGLSQAALQLLNIVPLLMYTIIGGILDKTPRKKYNRFVNIPGLGWGSTYPKFVLLGVIAITYSCIAPLILAFATVGFCLLYLMYRYNFLFVLGNKVDMKGEAYSRALKQLLTGVYLATLCLIGLFAIGVSKNKISIGPLVIMLVFLIIMIIFQIMLDRALAPLERHIPLDLMSGNKYSTTLSEQIMDEHEMKQSHLEAGTGSRDNSAPEFAKAEGDAPQGKTKPFNFLSRRLEPMVQRYYESNKSIVPTSDNEDNIPAYTSEEYENSYLNPAITSPVPTVWLARDPAGVSKVLVQENKEAKIPSTDEYAEFNEKNKLIWDEDKLTDTPLWQRRVRY